MSRLLTKKQKAFADELLETGNGTESALKTYDTELETTAASIASENIRKPKIIEYMQQKSPAAASMIFKLSQGAKNENVKLQASKDILDRSGFKALDPIAPIFNQFNFNNLNDDELKRAIDERIARIGELRARVIETTV